MKLDKAVRLTRAAFNRLTRVTVSEEVTFELAWVKRKPHRDQGEKKKNLAEGSATAKALRLKKVLHILKIERPVCLDT